MLGTASPIIANPSLRAPGRDIALSPTEVKDSFFAYVIGVIRSGVEVDISNAGMREILTEFKTSLDLPFDLVSSVRQHQEQAGGERTLSILFHESVKIPIPFSFLGYHPGSILASAQIRFADSPSAGAKPSVPPPTDPVFALRLTEGRVTVDVDDWLEWLLPGIVEDLSVNMIAIFKYQGDWFCLLSGTGVRRGDAIHEFFNFTHNRIVFPIPGDLIELGNTITALPAPTVHGQDRG